jgi:glycerol kinase
MKYIIALDQGTTSSRAVVIDSHGHVVGSHGIEFPQIYPQPGWVEHDPFEILQSQKEALRYAVQKTGVDPADVAAIGITNQRETTLLWERDTGKPIHNAIVWQCRRTADRIEELKAEGLSDVLREKTGLVPDAYFSGTKIAWMLDNVPGARERAERGELCFGTVDTWLAWNLTVGHRHVTDDTNACRTMLYNLHTGAWDEELLKILRVPLAVLPTIVPSSGEIGMLDKGILGREIPLCAIAGDQHAALFGQACFEQGMVKNTYGTGCFLLMNTGERAVVSKHNLLSTVAWSIGGKREFALEGSIFVAGAVVQWLRDEMKLLGSAAESEQVALSVPDAQGVYVVPAFTGLGAPHWDMYARGAIVGLTRGAGRAHIVRAALESIALQTLDVTEAMRRDSGVAMPQMRVDGGASANNFLMQFQADILGTDVLRPTITESTALGAAYMAGLAVGLWSGKKELLTLWQEERRFVPAMDALSRLEKVAGWHRAIERAKGWEK